MFSEAVLEHFRNPRNAGELPDATATVEVSNPVCGDILKLAARITGGRIAVSLPRLYDFDRLRVSLDGATP